MSLRAKFARPERIHMSWWRLLLQGVVILVAGVSLTILGILGPEVIVMHAHGLSFLPFSGIVILSLGLLECFDALTAKEQRDFLQNLQVGSLDAVVGGLILFNPLAGAERFNLMIVAFLMTRGIARIALCLALQLPHAVSTILGGMIAVAMGFLIWSEWPTGEGWFLALCLNIEIAFRGWAMMMFALWVRKRNAEMPVGQIA